MIKGLLQEDITIVNIYAPNIGAPQYLMQTLKGIKGEMDSNTIIVVDFNTPLTQIDSWLRQRTIHTYTQIEFIIGYVVNFRKNTLK